jgi:hypothetical protein
MEARTPALGIASMLNPEAGSHAVTADPAELAACHAATARIWQEFPYYERRYGERGRRFGISDSGWLATMRALSREAAEAQVLWLAGVLAARGMPRYLMERHLQLMHEELAPLDPDRHAVLAQVAAALHERRLRAMPAHRFMDIADAHERRTAVLPERVANFGVLLAAAACDERGGVVRALESVRDWACDPERFSAEWIAAVDDTLAEARRA